MKNEKGFTLVELIAVTVILITLTLLVVGLSNRQIDKSKRKALVKSALTYEKAALNKLSIDRTDGKLESNIFHSAIYGRVCYSIESDLTGKYVSGKNDNLKGSVEVCYGLDCTYETKVWLTDGTYYVDGLTGITDESQLGDSFTSTIYPYSCGEEAIGGGTSGSLLVSDYDYTGKEQEFIVILDGVYALEAWGAQGGSYQNTEEGGYGAYAYDEVQLKKGDKLYINVGEQGYPECTVNDASCKAAFNGGAKGSTLHAGGGGATSITTKKGPLYNLRKHYAYIIAGGGAGGTANNTDRFFLKHGGGYANLYWPNSREYGEFGRFGGFKQTDENYYGNGGGYSSSTQNSTTFENGDNFTTVGGTSYVFHSKVKNGVMYSYECTQYDIPVNESKTECNPKKLSDDPISKTAKRGNGYARITYLPDGFTQS